MALKASAATQPGGLNTLIGFDVGSIYPSQGALPVHTPGTHPAGLDADISARVIGGATLAVADSAYAGKTVRFEAATGAHAPGAAVGASTYLNRTGKTLANGQHVLAVGP